MFALELHGFSCNEKLFYMGAELKGIAVGEEDVGDLAFLDTAHFVRDVQNLCRIQCYRL